MISLKFDVEIRCEECGDYLDANFSSTRGAIYIIPCKSCIASAKEELEDKIDDLEDKIKSLEQ